VRPTSEQLSSLTPLERATFEVANVFAHPRLSIISKAWNTMFMGGMLYACGGRRFNVIGLEHLAPFGKRDSVLFVANHRSFFDFFSVTAMVYWRTNLTRRLFFPVRQTFFYDHPAGPVVNAVMSGMRMFPPMMRDKEKRTFNSYSVARCIEELDREDIGTVLGIHPEGTRNKGDDPYSFLPTQTGVGRIALGSKRVNVIPVFLLGMSQSIGREMKYNVLAPADHPVDVYFGAPIDFSDLKPTADDPVSQKAAADRCLDAIKELAERQRRDSARRDGRDPDAEPPVSSRPPTIPPRKRERPQESFADA
jgi:1-acyl-sn-glycerol-3-phosphate acyltransferase